MKSNVSNKRKKALPIALIALVIIAIIGGTLAFYTATLQVKNKFETKGYGAELVEKFTPEKEWEPGAVVNKEVGVKNTGDYNLLARISWYETWTKANNDTETITLLEEKKGDKVSEVLKNLNAANASKWIYHEGYFYYNGVIGANETQAFLDSVKLSESIDMVGQTEIAYYYTTSETEPAGDQVSENPDDAATKWVKVNNEDLIPDIATYKKSVSQPSEDSYANAKYELVIITELLQATKDAVMGSGNWSEFNTACPDVYASLPGAASTTAP